MKATLVLNGVKQRLNTFKKTGEVFSKQKGFKPNTNVRQKLPDDFRANSVNKTIKLLRNQYDGLIMDHNDNVMNLLKITAKDLSNKANRSKNLTIFKNLMKLKSIDKKPIDRRILLVLLGINLRQLKDKVLVTKTVEKLLMEDEDIERAKYLLKLSYYKNPVSLNRVTSFLLGSHPHKDKTDIQRIEEAIKLVNDGKKWGYDLNEQSYVILFGGIAKLLSYGQASDVMCEKLVNLFSKLCNDGTATTKIFNALLSVLLKNINNEQEMAWTLFNNLDNKLSPNPQSFTIFLNGINELYKFKFTEIKSRDISGDSKKLQYYKLSNELTGLAEMIKYKLLTVHKPDNYFLSVYLDSFINDFGDWGHNYSDLGLMQLVVWFPELNKLSNSKELVLDFSKPKRQHREHEYKKTMSSSSDVDGDLEVYERKAKLAVEPKKDDGELELNSFILKKFIQGLFQLDRPQQLMQTIWQILEKYGGVQFSELPNVTKEIYKVEVKHDLDFQSIEKPIDEKLIEYIMFHTSQVFLKETKASTINLYLVDYVKPIFPRTEGFVKMIVSIMNEEFHYFTRLNKNVLSHTSNKQKPLTRSQLQYLIRNLKHLTESNHEVINSNLEIMNKLVKNIDQILQAEWTDARKKLEKIPLNKAILDSCKNLSNQSLSTVLDGLVTK